MASTVAASSARFTQIGGFLSTVATFGERKILENSNAGLSDTSAPATNRSGGLSGSPFITRRSVMVAVVALVVSAVARPSPPKGTSRRNWDCQIRQ
jgi:hypothetical protein